jgi:hypothetical protein
MMLREKSGKTPSYEKDKSDMGFAYPDRMGLWPGNGAG